MTTPKQRLSGILIAPDVLRLLAQDRLLSDRARREAADLLAHYPTKAEIAAVLDNPEAALSTWLNVLLRCQRVFEILVGFCQGSEESQLAVRVALRDYPEPAAIQQLCGERVGICHMDPLAVDLDATRE
jgi:hypothetical protein